MDATTATREVDVLIVGAGLSGIGSARHLQRECPERSFARSAAAHNGPAVARWTLVDWRSNA